MYSSWFELFLREHQDQWKENTLKSYRYDLEGFLRFMEQRYERTLEDFSKELQRIFWSEVRQPDLYAYIQFLKNKEGSSQRTINRKLTSLRSFYAYLIQREGYQGGNPLDDIERYKVQASQPTIVRDSVFRDLPDQTQGRHPYRDQAILLLIMECGLRIQEVVSLKMEDYNSPYLRTERGVIKLGSHVQHYLDGYLQKERPIGPLDALFVSQKNKSISMRTIQHQMKKRNVTSKSLRNTAILKLLEHHEDVDQLQRFFGARATSRLEKVQRPFSEASILEEFDFTKAYEKRGKK